MSKGDVASQRLELASPFWLIYWTEKNAARYPQLLGSFKPFQKTQRYVPSFGIDVKRGWKEKNVKGKWACPNQIKYLATISSKATRGRLKVHHWISVETQQIGASTRGFLGSRSLQISLLVEACSTIFFENAQIEISFEGLSSKLLRRTQVWVVYVLKY